MGRRRHADCATGTLGGTPCGATKRVRRVPQIGRRHHAGCATGTLDGAPSGATKRERGVPKWGGAAMLAAPLAP
eukprot:7053377-Pyramimonas_sp.AAC.1